MTSLILASILLAVALLAVVVRKTYYATPLTELRRRAQQHDPLASQLYRAVAYGASLRGLLWLVITVSTALGIVLMARETPVWLSLLIFVGLLWVAFSWLPKSRVTPLGARLTTMVTPAIVWLLNYLHPVLNRGTAIVEKRYSAPAHTGLYERSDLLAIIDRQEHQADNRLSAEELEIVKRALNFNDHTVAEVLTPRKQIKTVLADDTVGPILIDEMHRSGEEVVLVRETNRGAVVGTLVFSQLDLKTTGKVRDVMDSTVYFVHENDNLSEALHVFFVTNRPMFVVVNNAEEYVGIITVKTMLEQLLGHIPGDDFDQYADAAAVAHRHRKPHIVTETAEVIENSDDLDLKVIE